MEYSTRQPWGLVVLLAVVDLGARLGAPGAVLALAHDEALAAILSATFMTALAGGRALVGGRVEEIYVTRLWRDVIRATRRHDVAALRARPDRHGTTALIDSVALMSHVRASVTPRLVADAVALVIVLGVTIIVVGVGWLALGVLALALGGAIVVAANRRMRQAERRSFDRFAEAAHDFEVLADAATELRAHGCETRHAERLHEGVRHMAANRRIATTYASLVGLFPLGVALLVAAVPLALNRSLLSERLIDAGVLGITGLLFGLGLARGVEAWARSAPQRQALESYLERPATQLLRGTAPVDLASATIELTDVSIVYAGSDRATPASFDLSWRAGSPGVAVTGANGAGKTTLALCLLGLVQPTEGQLRFGDCARDALDWERLRRRVVYVPQDGFVAGDRSIAWHLQLFAASPATEGDLMTALRRVGLWETLAHRAERSRTAPLATLASQLSGGERKRLHLARTLVGNPDLIVLDEPEAGLDGASRVWLRELVEELSSSSRVLLIAHDTSIIPQAFVRVACHAEAVGHVAPHGTTEHSPVALAPPQ